MPYDLQYAPTPPRRPDFNEYDRNALAQMLDPKQIWRQRQEAMMQQYMQSIHPGSMLGIRARMDQTVPMSDYAGGRDVYGEQGPPMPVSSNAIRDLIYQYMFPR